MDALTHGLASYAVTRAIFPRASGSAMIGFVVAGTAADVDALSASFGPSAYLTWQRTFTHSFAAALLIAVFVTVALWLVQRSKPLKDPIKVIFVGALGASLLHVAMDLCQTESVEALWPLGSQRYSADCLAHLDLWILLILLAGVLLPKLLGLVTEEIGAKSKSPRGRIGAIVALAIVGVYIGGRAILHGDAVAMLDSRTYHGESPRHVAAFAEPDSPLRWRGVVETERALHELQLEIAPGSTFNPEAGILAYKAGDSPALAAAQKTSVVRRLLHTVRFPKATVEQTSAGFRVKVREFSAQSASILSRSIAAIVDTDANANVTDEQLIWDDRAGKQR